MFINKSFLQASFEASVLAELRGLKDDMRNMKESIESIVAEIESIKTIITSITETLRQEINMARCTCYEKNAKSTSMSLLLQLSTTHPPFLAFF